MKRITPLLFLLFIVAKLLDAQNTVGLLSYNPAKAYEGYNLIYPHNQPTVFLLNNCGEIVHTWEDEANLRPGNTAYILENGNLLKCKRMGSSAVNDPIWAGGGGETVDLRTWDNQLLATFTLNNEDFRLHHDVAALPNGNVLMIAWELKTGMEALEAGRDTSQLSQGEVWSERILEWDPVLNEIVWEWSVWDHLVQDFDPQRANFGVVADHPELINVNYDEHDGHPDWLHINSIDYNPVLDQFVLSVPYFNELWVIDHSTSTEEAAGHTGGRSGKGGDLLYRWGNPAAYNKGAVEDKKFFFQHDIHWVNGGAVEGDPYFGKIALFNNRVANNYSTGNVINTGFDASTNSYSLEDGVFIPADFEQIYVHPEAETDLRAASTGLSSFQILPNGNVLFCSGRRGYAYEVDSQNKVIWEYFTPIKSGSPVEQGDTTIDISNNLTFRMQRYPISYPAFDGKDLTAKGYIELNPDEEFCENLTVSINEVQIQDATIEVFPNPVDQLLTVSRGNSQASLLNLFDLLGKNVRSLNFRGPSLSIDVNELQPGIYFLGTENGLIRKIVVR